MRQKMFTLLCFVFFVGLSLVKTDTEADGYSGEVKALFEDLAKYKTQVLNAKEKMNEFQSEPWDRQYSIALINLYTQPGDFFITLNTEMNNGYPAKTDMWKRAGNSINRAVSIIGLKSFKQVYRGCQKLDALPIPGKEYHFNHIITASQSKDTAVKYINCAKGFLFKIENVRGASVEKYSHYPKDREVIINSTLTYYVYDGLQKESNYDIYFLRGQAIDSERDGNNNDVIHANLGFVWFILIALFILILFGSLLCVVRSKRWSRSKMYKKTATG